MNRSRSSLPSDLERRLEAHLGGEFDASLYAWWHRVRVRPRRRGLLEAELPAVSEQLAELMTAGCGLTAATARVAWRGRGLAADDLASVAQQLRAGRPAGAVWRQWGASSGSDAVGSLASLLAIDQPATDLAYQLQRQAQILRERAHHERLGAVARRVRLMWLAAIAQLLLLGVAATA